MNRVLVGDSVFEDADLTVRDGRLYIEFEADDLDSITVDLRPLNPAAPWLLPEHLVGGKEIRELVGGIQRNTLLAWRRDRGFPEPIARLEIGEVWDLRDVKEWMRGQ
jgi:prophage regulatory protein